MTSMWFKVEPMYRLIVFNQVVKQKYGAQECVVERSHRYHVAVSAGHIYLYLLSIFSSGSV